MSKLRQFGTAPLQHSSLGPVQSTTALIVTIFVAADICVALVLFYVVADFSRL